jgi:hypothetical protein
MNDLPEIEKLINDEMSIAVHGSANVEDLKRVLAAKFNDLINHDFNRLVQILYRIDINEAKLKTVLEKNTGHDAGRLLAELTIERQLQKIRSRQQYTKPDENISEDEKW